jgi:hypothetical protein
VQDTYPKTFTNVSFFLYTKGSNRTIQEVEMYPGLSIPLFAPLAADQVWDLLASREADLPRERTQRGTNMLEWSMQRFLRVQELLLPDVANARQRVFALLDPVVREGHLTARWLIDTLYPPPLTPYPDRLREWKEENFLRFDQNGEPEPQTVAAILLQRELDSRKRKLPHPRSQPRSYSCFRYETPGSGPISYELPFAPVDASHPSFLKPIPAEEPLPYILSTPWKGASWGDPAWIAYEEGAVRWVGQPSEDQLAAWLLPQESASLELLPGQADRARQALSLLADRLQHSSSSSDPT